MAPDSNRGWKEGISAPATLMRLAAGAGREAQERISIVHALLHSTKGHLDLPFVPTASTIGGQIQAIHPIILIDDAIVLPTVVGPSETTVTVGPSTLTEPERPLTCFRRNDSETFRNSTIQVFRLASYTKG